ncbi:MAG TPA: flagellar motor protein MotB [Aquifex aeolicus]|nr:flagellar motor protein MotB [Aquifex aeolicus]
MAKKKGGEQDCPKFPAWMTTFSDLMSLLLTFFILLYSMSVIDITSFFKLVSFFQGGRTITPPATVIPPPVSPPQISRLAIKAQKILSKIHAYSAFQVIVSRNEITIRFPYGVNFDKGDYKLKPKFKRALQEIVPLIDELKDKTFRLVVQGFASSMEKPKYPFIADNWELSAKRATEVVRFLIKSGLDRKKITAEAYGTLRPVYTGDNKLLLKKNARVELHLRFYNEDYLRGNLPAKEEKRIIPIPELERLFGNQQNR